MQITTQKCPDDLQLQQSVTSSTAIPVAPYNTTLRNQQYSFNPSNANSITSTEEQVFLFKMPDSIHLSTLEKPQTQDIKQLWLPSTSHKSLKIQQDNKLILTNKAVYFLWKLIPKKHYFLIKKRGWCKTKVSLTPFRFF